MDNFLSVIRRRVEWPVEVSRQMSIQNGDLVKIRAYGGEIQVRRLVEVKGKMAIITTDAEREIAAREKREPVRIGIPLEDVIEAVKEKSKPLI